LQHTHKKKEDNLSLQSAIRAASLSSDFADDYELQLQKAQRDAIKLHRRNHTSNITTSSYSGSKSGGNKNNNLMGDGEDDNIDQSSGGDDDDGSGGGRIKTSSPRYFVDDYSDDDGGGGRIAQLENNIAALQQSLSQEQQSHRDTVEKFELQWKEKEMELESSDKMLKELKLALQQCEEEKKSVMTNAKVICVHVSCNSNNNNNLS
jgi:hypothetical protein